jgi:hypothetical protein
MVLKCKETVGYIITEGIVNLLELNEPIYRESHFMNPDLFTKPNKNLKHTAKIRLL